MLTARNIFKRYGPVKVLLGVSFSFSRGQKIALVGPNGVGKSTLLRILAGQETEDRGVIEKSRRLLTGYLPQEVAIDSGEETVLEYFRTVSGITEIEAEMKQLETKLSDETLLAEYGELEAAFDRLGGYVFEKKCRKALDGLGLERIALEQKVAKVSGGERRRVALASVLLKGADLLLLDEPTNDLDLESLLWLEDYLIRAEAAVLVASHDREFLDHIAEKVLEIDWHFRTAEMFTGNYTTYQKEKAERLRRERELYDRAEEERGRLHDTSDEKKEWARIGGEQVMPDNDKMSQGYHRDRSERKFGAASKALLSRADQVDRLQLTPLRTELALLFEPQEGLNRAITLSKLVCGYPGTGFSVGPVDMDISYGKRIGIFGRNGAGKSTLIKTILGDLAQVTGTVKRGAELHIGNLSQENTIVPKDKTAMEWFLKETPLEESSEVHLYLGKFLLNAEAAEFKMGELSPGERMRLTLAYFMAKGVNVLALDEPTNHLDMDAIAALEEALRLYQGTLLLVSHDRAFLANVALTDVYSIEQGALVKHADYEAYLAHVKK
jgi:ATP-binding cassette subfamily F protein 3